ncbi:MAG: signal recognition particle-docking protein FtsY [Candidatus Woesearchaeota archaeon]|jgi:fused signal recognition particle receptor|nr:signal recognition particle-docking protein FtsY [Candidatus Woesearchaeota archaeon]
MFNKIKGKLKSIFETHEEIIDESEGEETVVEEEVIIKKKEKPKKEKKKEELEVEEKIIEEVLEETPCEKEEETKASKGFFSKVFGKSKEEKDEEELEELQDEMLEGAPEEEKKAIKEKTELEGTSKNKKELDKAIEKEEQVEKKELVKAVEEEKDEEIVEPKVSEGVFSKTFKKLKAKKVTGDDFLKIWTELEMFLLEINIAYEIVQSIETRLKKTLIDNSYDRFKLSKVIREVLIDEVEKVLISREGDFLSQIKKLNRNGEIAKILVLGVNGTGKTTSIAKIVNLFQKNDLSVVVAAADTFRAAAIEQLGEHAKRLNFKLVQHKGGSDPAAVAFDAIEHANAKKLNVVLIDTAGRMPNNSNLMLELEKIKRVSSAQLSVFVGDSVSGNDLIDQIELFDKIVGIDGMILTKTDTDERPGSIVTAAYSIDKPIYYLGIGQGYDDLVKFDAKIVAEKLFEIDDED